MKFDVEAGKYCFPDFNLKEKAYLDFKFYERGGAGNESKLIAGPYFNSSGAVLLPAGIYDAVVSTTVDGVYAEMKCTKGSEITITAARVWTGKVGEKLTPPSSGDNRNVYYVIPSTGVFDYYYVFLGENGYHVGGSLTSIIAPIDIKILDADGNEITDALDENYILSDKIAAGTYTIVITVHYQGTHQESLVSLTVTE
jgi:hypothetical protein